jgi:hypothetical protein
MPSERAARDDFLAAAEHIRKLMSIADETDELIPCGRLSRQVATRIREIPEYLLRCAGDEHPLFRMLRDSVDSLLAIFNEDRVAAALWEDHRIAKARKVLKQTAPASDQQKLEIAIGHINDSLDMIRDLDEGDECDQLKLRHDEDIGDASDFVRSHTMPEPPGDQPYTVIGFTTVDEMIDYLGDNQPQSDEGSDYGDADEDWIVP